MRLYCYTDHSGTMTWFRKQENQEPQELPKEGHISQTKNGSEHILTIHNIQYEDNGIYFCKQECNGTNFAFAQGCGTELRVLGVCKVDLCLCSQPPFRPNPACLPGEVAMALEPPVELLGGRA